MQHDAMHTDDGAYLTLDYPVPNFGVKKFRVGKQTNINGQKLCFLFYSTSGDKKS